MQRSVENIVDSLVSDIPEKAAVRNKILGTAGLLRFLRLNYVAYMFLLPTFFLMGLLVFYPLIKGIWFSFTNINQYNMGNTFLPPSYEFVGLENYYKVFFGQGTQLYQVLGQSMVFTLGSVTMHIILGLGLALLLNQKLPGRTWIRMMLLVPWAVPSFVSAFAWRWLFNSEYGFFNQVLPLIGLGPIDWLSDAQWAMFAVILTNIWLGFPFMMVSFLGGLQSIPHSLYEAARVDGAGKIRQFFFITLPMLKPVAFTVTLLGVIWTFNLFHVIYLVTGGGPFGQTEILPTFTYAIAFQRWEFGLASTYGVIILSTLVVFSTVYHKLARYNY